tara:strand:- start:77 stop:1024 length:948 start_codon:yes stop_codon:yes gene_type:complete
MVHPYIKRRKGNENIELPPPPLQKVLKKTLGIPLFQEQAMQIAIIGANFSALEADKLRRSLATFKNNGDISVFRNRFITGMLKNGYKRDLSEKCFSQIEGFSKYGFPESHAASFALIVYASAWIKFYYPEIFACSLLNSQPMGFYSTNQIIYDAKKHGVEILPLCINNSLWDNNIELKTEDRPSLRIGFRQIKGLSKTIVEKIISERGNGFKNINDFWERTNLSYRTFSKLIKSDCFSGIGLKRNEALWEARGLYHKEKGSLFEKKSEITTAPKPPIILPNVTLGNELIKDYSSLNFSLKSHPMVLLRSIINKKI